MSIDQHEVEGSEYEFQASNPKFPEEEKASAWEEEN